MTTRQRYKRILGIIEGISHIQNAAARAEAEQNRDAITILTRAYSALLGDALRLDPKGKHIRVLGGAQ